MALFGHIIESEVDFIPRIWTGPMFVPKDGKQIIRVTISKDNSDFLLANGYEKMEHWADNYSRTVDNVEKLSDELSWLTKLHELSQNIKR